MSHSTFNLPTVTKLTKANKSFTLIEMLVVVVIIGILAGVLVPRLVGARERASDSARIVKVGQISSAVELYAQENGGTYPVATLTGTPGISIATPSVSTAISSYLTTIPTDPGKGTVAIDSPPSNIQVTGDSFAYWTNTGGTVYAITALMESKKGNTTNAVGMIDSNKQGSYQVVGKGLTIAYGFGGAPIVGVTQVLNDLVISDGTTTYVIADRNVGATQAGTDHTNPAIRGVFFQWGNNHPFSSTVGETITPNSTGQVDTSTYNGTNPYNNSTWIYGTTLPRYDWSLAQNDNLRGNTTNTNEARKGPCDPGYHIPTQAERQGLYNIWVKIYSGDAMYLSSKGNLFRDTLKLPMAGYRYYVSASSVDNQGSYGYYWSSTPVGQLARYLDFNSSYVNPGFANDRAYGFSARCFKNSY